MGRMVKRIEMDQIGPLAAKFEVYLQRKQRSLDGERFSREKRFLLILSQREEIRTQTEAAVSERILVAFDALVDRTKQKMTDLNIPLPDEFEYDEHQIVVMDAMLRHPEDAVNHFLPRSLYNTAFDRLVESGVLQRTITPGRDNDEERKDSDYFFIRYKRPQAALTPVNT